MQKKTNAMKRGIYRMKLCGESFMRDGCKMIRLGNLRRRTGSFLHRFGGAFNPRIGFWKHPGFSNISELHCIVLAALECRMFILVPYTGPARRRR